MTTFPRSYPEKLTVELEKLVELLSEGLVLTNFVRDELLGENGDEIRRILKLANNLNHVSEAIIEVDKRISFFICGQQPSDLNSDAATVLAVCDRVDEISGSEVRRICVIIAGLAENLKVNCNKNIDLSRSLSGAARTTYVSLLKNTGGLPAPGDPIEDQEDSGNLPVLGRCSTEGNGVFKANGIREGEVSLPGNKEFTIGDLEQFPEIAGYTRKPVLGLSGGSCTTPEERVFSIGKALRAYESAEKAEKAINQLLDTVIDRLGYANRKGNVV